MPRPLRLRPLLAALLRPVLAAILLAAVTAPLLPVRGATAAAGCAMCARRCCCKPAADGEGCRLSRPCGPAEADAATAAPGLPRPALLDAVLPDAAPPAAVAPLPAAPRDLPLAAPDPPPVPPPRRTAR